MDMNLILDDLKQKILDVGAEESKDGGIVYHGIPVEISFDGDIFHVRIGSREYLFSPEEANETYFQVTEDRLEMVTYGPTKPFREFRGIRFPY